MNNTKPIWDFIFRLPSVQLPVTGTRQYVIEMDCDKTCHSSTHSATSTCRSLRCEG